MAGGGDLIRAFAAEFKTALADSPDAILSDSNVPGFNGLSALALARTLAPEVPVIFFCGDRREDLQRDVLIRDAVAFVPKDDPDRLIKELPSFVSSE